MNESTVSLTRLEFLTFTVSDQEYALEIMSVREIRGWTKTTPLPHAPPCLSGVVNLRGAVLPVMDLSVRLGLPAVNVTKRNVIIVTEHDQITTGLLVNSVSDILSLSESDLQPVPTLQEEDGVSLVRALICIDDRMIRVLSLDNVLAITQEVAA